MAVSVKQGIKSDLRFALGDINKRFGRMNSKLRLGTAVDLLMEKIRCMETRMHALRKSKFPADARELKRLEEELPVSKELLSEHMKRYKEMLSA